MNAFTGEIVQFRTGYNYDTDAVSLDTALVCNPDEGLTQQHHAEDADINTIVRRFGLTGELPPAKDIPQYGDFSEVMDYHTAMTALNNAQHNFMALPAEIRQQFNNDPGALLDFLQDDKNRPRAEEMGLVTKQPKPVESAPASATQPKEGST